MSAQQGDQLELFVQFDDQTLTFDVDQALRGFEPGFWGFSAGVNFFLVGPEGQVVKYFGTMGFGYKLTPPWNGIALEAEPDSIGQGEASAITLQAIEAPGKPVKVPFVTSVRMGIGILGQVVGGLSLPEYGLRYIAGFTASYGIAANTPIFYEAFPDSLVPLDIVFAQVPVVAYSPYDTGINGITSVTVAGEEEDLLVHFIKPGKIKIWPTLPGGAYSGRNTNDNNIKKNITVEVTRGREPVINKKVELVARYVPQTGGHDHTNEELTSTGKFSYADNNVYTNENGRVRFSYEAPLISGKFKLTARVIKDDVTYKDKKVVIVKVPKLKPLGTSPYFELVGAPDNNKTTNDPCRTAASLNSIHFNNHYGRKKLNNAIRRIVKDYYLNDDQTKLRINDMSLIWGGIFDIHNNWNDPHWEHRIGKQADIGSSGIDKNGICERNLKLTMLTSIINKETDQQLLIHYNDNGAINHFHVRVK